MLITQHENILLTLRLFHNLVVTKRNRDKMRFILTILIFNTTIVMGQTETRNCPTQIDTLTNLEVYKVVDEMPTVSGGMQVLYQTIRKGIKYQSIDEYSVQSKIIIAFIVGSDGQITGKRIIQNVAGTNLAQQMLDIVDDLKWQPGKCNGIPVPTLQLIPMMVHYK